MKTITNWTARRSGAAITIEGKTRAEHSAGDEPIKVSGIETIEGEGRTVIACAAGGELYRLA